MLKYFGIAIALLALSACHEGSSSDSVPSATASPTTSPTTSVSGTGAKGIIKNGVVRGYAAPNGQRGELLAETTTGTDGSYSLDVGEYSGLLLVIVSANPDGSTTMSCDLSGGCSDGAGSTTPFGSDIVLDANFELTACLSVAPGQITVNVTPFTTASVALAERRVRDNPQADPVVTIRSTNSAIANLFGLLGDVTGSPVVDLTQNAAGLGDASEQAILGSALGSAAVEAAINGPNTRIDQAIAAFVTNVVDSSAGGQSAARLQNSEIARIYQRAQAVLTKAQSNAGVEQGSQQAARFNQANNSAGTRETQASNSQSEFQEAEASPGTDSDELGQVKLFVQDLRNLANGVTADALSSGSSAFGTQVEAAAGLIADDSEFIFLITGAVIEVIGQAYEALQEDPTITQYSNDGITVSISIFENEVTLNVDQAFTESSSADVTVVLELDLFEFADETDNGNGSTVFEVFELVLEQASIIGTVQNGDTRLTLLDVSLVGDAFSDSEETDSFEQTDGGSVFTFEEELIGGADLSLILSARLQRLSGDMESFTGNIIVDIEGLFFEEAFSFEDSRGAGEIRISRTEVSVTSFTLANFVMNGTFSNANDEMFDAFLQVNVDGTTFGDYIDGRASVETYSNQGENTFGETAQSSEESQDQFFGFAFTLGIEATIADLTDDVSILLSGSRDSFRAGNVELNIAYMGRRINFGSDVDADAQVQSVLIENQDGVTAEISVDDSSDPEVTGRLLNNGSQYGTISGVIIRFNDGTFQSL